MTRGTEYKYSLMKFNSLIQVRHDTLLVKPVLEAIGEVVER